MIINRLIMTLLHRIGTSFLLRLYHLQMPPWTINKFPLQTILQSRHVFFWVFAFTCCWVRTRRPGIAFSARRSCHVCSVSSTSGISPQLTLRPNYLATNYPKLIAETCTAGFRLHLDYELIPRKSSSAFLKSIQLRSGHAAERVGAGFLARAFRQCRNEWLNLCQ